MKQSDICDFKKNYIVTKEKHNVIIVTLFRLKHLYKDFSAYMDGLIGFDNYLSQFNKIKNNIKLRVYWNTSIYETNNLDELNYIKTAMVKVSKNIHIQLIEYSCNAYKIDDIFDRGIFPFFLRYFPLFDFKDNDTNYVYSTDIDIGKAKQDTGYYGYIIDEFNKIIQKKSDYLFLSATSYKPFWKSRLNNDSIVSLGCMVCGKYKSDYNILINFLKECEYGLKSKDKLISTFYKNYIEYINNNRIPEENRIKKINSYKTDNIFVYGLDEFFITYYLLKHILSNNAVKNVVQKSVNTINLVFYGALKNTFYNITRNINISEETLLLYKSILFKLLKKKYELKEVYTKVKELIRSFKTHDYLNETDVPKTYNKFHKIIMKIYESKDSKLLNLNDKGNEFKIFKANNIYYTDKNCMNKLSNETRKQYYKQLCT